MMNYDEGEAVEAGRMPGRIVNYEWGNAGGTPAVPGGAAGGCLLMRAGRLRSQGEQLVAVYSSGTLTFNLH